jgi:glycosyltransferase involved in cell wall biosynthesis
LGLPENALIVFASFNLASSLVRKNPLGIVKAFRIAFGNRQDRILALKVINCSHFPDDFAQLTAAVKGADNIRLITETLSPEASAALTSAADIVMSLHRSEGFGLVAAEGMLLGKPVIVTDWSAPMEFMDESCAALVRSRLVPAADPRRVYDVRDAMWADPDLEHAAEWLQRLADDPGLRRNLGDAAYAAASARLGTDTLANAVNGLGVRMAKVLERMPGLGPG